MLNAIIKFSLHNRGIVLIGGLLILLYGGYQLTQMPVDALSR